MRRACSAIGDGSLHARTQPKEDSLVYVNDASSENRSGDRKQGGSTPAHSICPALDRIGDNSMLLRKE